MAKHRKWYDTGVRDMHGSPVYEGHVVRYNNSGPHTKPEYWCPEYVVEFAPPCFCLRHVGGGASGGNTAFILRCGGSNGMLEIIGGRRPR